MALKDLIVSNAHITSSLLEEILKGRINLVQENNGVILTAEFKNFSKRYRILLFLCGKHAWQLINDLSDKILSSIEEISNGVAIYGSTVRGALMELKNEHLVNATERGKYFITIQGIDELRRLIKEEAPQSFTRKVSSKKSQKDAVRSNVEKEHKEKSFNQSVVTSLRPKLVNLKATDKFLFMIYMAKEFLGIDGLTAAEVKFLLTEPPISSPGKFYTSNVSRDLGKMRNFVTSYRASGASDGSYEYRLNEVGEKYIKSLIEQK